MVPQTNNVLACRTSTKSFRMLSYAPTRRGKFCQSLYHSGPPSLACPCTSTVGRWGKCRVRSIAFSGQLQICHSHSQMQSGPSAHPAKQEATVQCTREHASRDSAVKVAAANEPVGRIGERDIVARFRCILVWFDSVVESYMLPGLK